MTLNINLPTKLSEMLPKLEEEIAKLRKSARSTAERPRPSKKRFHRLLILENYEDAMLIFHRILKALAISAVIQEKAFIETPQESWPSAEQQELITSMTEAQRHLSLDVKSLYVWTATIRDIFKNSNVNIDLKELERISLVRHKLITHVHSDKGGFSKTSLYPRGGIRLHASKEEVEILFNVHFSKAKFAGFRSAVKSALPFIPELKKEKNQFEQLNILYRNINDVTDPAVRRRICQIILRIGVATDQPSVIAKALFKALREYRRS